MIARDGTENPMGSSRRRHGQIFCSMQNLHSPALWVKPEVRLHGCRTTAWMQEVEQRRSSCRGTTPWMEEVELRLEQRPRATQEQLPNARSSATTRHKARRASQANAGARHRCLTERAAQRRSEGVVRAANAVAKSYVTAFASFASFADQKLYASPEFRPSEATETHHQHRSPLDGHSARIPAMPCAPCWRATSKSSTVMPPMA